MKRIYTIGHSTRTFEELVALLQVHGVRQLADVRSYPTSRRHPHFARQSLENTLPRVGVSYVWMPRLGGRRRPAAGPSTNRGWRVAGFRAYADAMTSPEFAGALRELEAWALKRPTAFMCAEALYFRCHRQLLSDALLARGWCVLHITSVAAAREHRLTSFAHVDETGAVTYPGEPELPLS
ncbi:MAG: DUF488 family protein [Candidatus Krumholzibacteriia bacterium]